MFSNIVDEDTSHGERPSRRGPFARREKNPRRDKALVVATTPHSGGPKWDGGHQRDGGGGLFCELCLALVRGEAEGKGAGPTVQFRYSGIEGIKGLTPRPGSTWGRIETFIDLYLRAC